MGRGAATTTLPWRPGPPPGLCFRGTVWAIDDL